MPQLPKKNLFLKPRPFMVTEEGWESLLAMQKFLEEYNEFFGYPLDDNSSIRNDDKSNLFEFYSEMENAEHYVSRKRDYQNRLLDDVKLSASLYQYLESENLIQPNYSTIENFVLEFLPEGNLQYWGKLPPLNGNEDELKIANITKSINEYVTNIQDELSNIINEADNVVLKKLIDFKLEEKILNIVSPEAKVILMDFATLQVYFKAVYDNLFEQ